MGFDLPRPAADLLDPASVIVLASDNVEIAPRTREMNGLLSLVRNEGRGWRDWIDLEHNICYSPTNHWNALTDGRWKYIFHANTGQEHWKVAADGRIGRVMYRVPKLGFVVVKVQSPAGRLVLIIIPALLLGFSVLRRIWRREPSAGSLDEPAS